MSTRYLCGVIMIAFFAMAGLFSLNSIASSGDISLGQGFLQGNVTKAYEKEFESNLKHQKASVKLWNSLGYALFGEGKKGVLIGQDGWLFTNEEFIYENNFQINLKKNKNYILQVSEQLNEKSIKLIVVPVPSKARVYRDRLGRYSFPEVWETEYRGFLKFLGKNNIVYENLLSTFTKVKQNNLYLRTDTHWTPIGARLAAMKVGYITQEKFPYLSWGKVPYKSFKSGVVKHEGDLMRYTASNNSKIFGVRKDIFDQWQSSPQEQKENNLFDNPVLPVTLVGTSFSANKLWNFDGFLKEFLGTDILNVADEGRGPFEAMQRYMNSQAYKDYKPKLIVWELPERYLGVLPEFMKETE